MLNITENGDDLDLIHRVFTTLMREYSYYVKRVIGARPISINPGYPKVNVLNV